MEKASDKARPPAASQLGADQLMGYQCCASFQGEEARVLTAHLAPPLDVRTTPSNVVTSH